LAESGAGNATGALPDVGLIGGGASASYVVGAVTFSISSPSTELYIGWGSPPADFTSITPGADIALSAAEHLNADLRLPVTSFGFEIVEPDDEDDCLPGYTGPEVCHESTYEITLLDDALQVDQLMFSPANNVLAFFGVTTDAAFNRVEIRETPPRIDNEYFGQFYATPGCGNNVLDAVCSGDPSRSCAEDSDCEAGQECEFEECDDGNETAGDGCDDLCAIESFCGPLPEVACRESGPRGGKIIIKDRTLRQRQVKVKWSRGNDTDYDEFCEAADTQQLPDGNYHVCVYDDVAGTPELFLETVVRPGKQCARKPCWKHKVGRKCKFKDKNATIRGVSKLQLRSGVGGKARWKLRAKGKDVPPPDLGETGRTFPMTVQMLIDDGSGNCWQTNYESAKKNDGEKLIAKK
jgi:cysteine-rich repeat protein